jgi:hypothetical protein
VNIIGTTLFTIGVTVMSASDRKIIEYFSFVHRREELASGIL